MSATAGEGWRTLSLSSNCWRELENAIALENAGEHWRLARSKDTYVRVVSIPHMVVRMPSKRVPTGYNPVSLENLIRTTPAYGERKEMHTVSVTPTAWEGIEAMAKELGIRSRSELVERIGRGIYQLVPMGTPSE